MPWEKILVTISFIGIQIGKNAIDAVVAIGFLA